MKNSTIWAKHYELGWMQVVWDAEPASWGFADCWVDTNNEEAGHYNTEDFDDWWCCN